MIVVSTPHALLHRLWVNVALSRALGAWLHAVQLGPTWQESMALHRTLAAPCHLHVTAWQILIQQQLKSSQITTTVLKRPLWRVIPHLRIYPAPYPEDTRSTRIRQEAFFKIVAVVLYSCSTGTALDSCTAIPGF